MAKKIKIVDIEIHRSSKAPMVFYEFDFGDLGKMESSMTLWKGATKEDIKSELKRKYRDEKKLRQDGEEDLSKLVSTEIDVAE